MSQLKVNTIRHTGASSDAITLAADGTAAIGECTAKITNQPPSNRNILINGAMTVSQRGTEETGISGTWAYRKAPDRWFFDGTPSGAAWTVGQATEAPAGFANSYKVQCTTADTSLAADDTVLLYQRIEGQDVQHLLKGTSDAKKLVLSFYLKTSKTGVYVINLDDIDNSRRNNKSITVSDTNWNRYTLVFEGDTTGAFGNDNEASLGVTLWLAAGANHEGTALPSGWHANNNDTRATGNVNFADNTSNVLYFTGVQLEVGDVATDFEHRSYGEELAKCQRYCFNLITTNCGQYATLAIGTYYNSSSVYSRIPFPVTMRSKPTLLTSDLTDGYNVYRNGAVDFVNNWVLGANQSGCNGAQIWNGDDASGTGGHGCMIRRGSSSTNYFVFDAEI